MTWLSRHLALAHGLLAVVGVSALLAASVILGRQHGTGLDRNLLLASLVIATPQVLALISVLLFRHWAGTAFAFVWSGLGHLAPMNVLMLFSGQTRGLLLYVLACDTFAAVQLVRGVQLFRARRRLARSRHGAVPR